MIRRYIFIDHLVTPMQLYDIIAYGPNYGWLDTSILLDNYAASLGLPRNRLSSTTDEAWVKKNFAKP